MDAELRTRMPWFDPLLPPPPPMPETVRNPAAELILEFAWKTTTPRLVEPLPELFPPWPVTLTIDEPVPAIVPALSIQTPSFVVPVPPPPPVPATVRSPPPVVMLAEAVT